MEGVASLHVMELSGEVLLFIPRMSLIKAGNQALEQMAKFQAVILVLNALANNRLPKHLFVHMAYCK